MKENAAPVRVFTNIEKRELAGHSFRDITLDGVDLAEANLTECSFEGVSLRSCDFRRADLRGARFLRCDLRDARLEEVMLGGNRFHGSCLAGATGLTPEQHDYVCRRGGVFTDPQNGEGSRLKIVK